MLSHGSGWDEKRLRHCLRVAETFDKAGESGGVVAWAMKNSWRIMKCDRMSFW